MPTLPSYLLRPRHVGTRDASSRALRITTHGQGIILPAGCSRRTDGHRKSI